MRRFDLSNVLPQAGNWQESLSSGGGPDRLLSPALLPTSSLLTLPGLVRSDSLSLAPPACWSLSGGMLVHAMMSSRVRVTESEGKDSTSASRPEALVKLMSAGRKL